MATSTNLKATQTCDDRNTCKKTRSKGYLMKKLLVVTPAIIVVTIVTRQIVVGRQEGAFQKKGGAEMAVGVRQAP